MTWIVVDTWSTAVDGKLTTVFRGTYDAAVSFIGTQADAEQGRYGLDPVAPTVHEVEQRGRGLELYGIAVEIGDEDDISIAHPANWLTEEEVECDTFDRFLDDVNVALESATRAGSIS